MDVTHQFEGCLILYDVWNVMAWCLCCFIAEDIINHHPKKKAVSHMFALKIFSWREEKNVTV